MPKRIDETQPKCCTKCKVVKPASEFGKGIQRADGTFGLAPKCKECRVAEATEYRKLNLEKYKTWQVTYNRRHREEKKNDLAYLIQRRLYKSRTEAKKFGYKPCNATVEELLEVFTGKCQVCGISESKYKHKLNMDHCHFTGNFRGWLCGNCNKAIGLMKDSPGNILALAGYVEYAGVKKSA